MLKAGDIIQCECCGATLEIEEDDLDVAIGSHGSLIYITCPACGGMAATEGITDIFNH